MGRRVTSNVCLRPSHRRLRSSPLLSVHRSSSEEERQQHPEPTSIYPTSLYLTSCPRPYRQLQYSRSSPIAPLRSAHLHSALVHNHLPLQLARPIALLPRHAAARPSSRPQSPHLDVHTHAQPVSPHPAETRAEHVQRRRQPCPMAQLLLAPTTASRARIGGRWRTPSQPTGRGMEGRSAVQGEIRPRQLPVRAQANRDVIVRRALCRPGHVSSSHHTRKLRS